VALFRRHSSSLLDIHPPLRAVDRSPSAEVARFVALFNQRDWEGLRALLAARRQASAILVSSPSGRGGRGMFFTIYVKMDRVSLSPAWIEGRAVAAVFEDRADPKPSYVMWLAWRQRPKTAWGAPPRADATPSARRFARGGDGGQGAHIGMRKSHPL
jgi:hypothetical protein